MRLASFNLENLDDQPNGEPSLEERLAVLRPQLLRLDADLLALQEVNAQKLSKGPRELRALGRLLEDTPYRDFHCVSTEGTNGKGPADKHNLVLLSRWPIASSRQIWHDHLPPPEHRLLTAQPEETEPQFVRWERPIQHAEVTLPGGRHLHIVNLHLRAPLAAAIPGQKSGPFAWKSVAAWAEGFYLAALKRCGQALEVRLLVESLFDADPAALIAVCGDFNAEDRETPLRIIRSDLEDTGNGALSARALVPLGRSLPRAQGFTVLHHGHPLTLDHLLVSKSLMATYRSIEVHNEWLGDELVDYATVSHSPESYHAPLVAAFDLAALTGAVGGAGTPSG